ncbi:TrmH family RNA methyltransferase [Salinispira pacifica]
MITIRKLSTLKPQTRLRKISRILESAERFPADDDTLRAGADPPLTLEYLRALAELAASTSGASARLRAAGEACADVCRQAGANQDAIPDAVGRTALRRPMNRLRHAILDQLGAEAAEWDLLPRYPEGAPAGESGAVAGNTENRRVWPAALYLEDIRSPFNVGSIVRSAAAFGIERVILSPESASLDHPRALRSAMGAERLVSVERRGLEEIERADVAIFALELGGTPLPEFTFPSEGIAIMGSEELGVSPAALRAAERSWGRVSIPLRGAKASLNVGVACGILLAAWTESLAAARAE